LPDEQYQHIVIAVEAFFQREKIAFSK